MRKAAMAILVSISLSGCGMGNGGTLSCPAPGETGCDSLDSVYQKTAGIDSGEHGAGPRRIRFLEGQAIPRLREAQVVRIWLAPWKDKQGDLHDHQYLYMIVQSPQWDVDHLDASKGGP